MWPAMVAGDWIRRVARRKGRQTMKHVAVVHFDLEPVEELEPEQVAEVLARDLINDGYDSYVVDIMEVA